MTNGAPFGHLKYGEEIGMQGGFAAGDLHNVGVAFIPDNGVEHFFNEGQLTVFRPLGTTGGITNRATEIAGIRNFDKREAGVLLVVGAKSAIVRAAPFDGGIVKEGHFRAFDEHFPATAVIVDIVGNQNTFRTVLRATLE